MEDKKREEAEVATSEKEEKGSLSQEESRERNNSDDRAGSENKSKTPFNGMKYLIAFLIVAIIALGLIFVLEKDGRISTGLFSGVIENMENSKPAAKVNGVAIPHKDFKSSYDQLLKIGQNQGMDVTDPEVIAEFNSQAIETLINGELLRQAALEKGMTASEEEIETRFGEISDSLGGEEVLATRMEEFGITEVSLKRDIENEILIQGLFDQELGEGDEEVSDEEVAEFYNSLGGEGAGLPPLEEVSADIKEQIVFERKQLQISEYIDQLRSEAEIEVLI